MKKPAVNSKRAPSYPSLLTGIGALLEESRRAVVRAANCLMTATHWEVGRRIVEFEQGGKKRAAYGEELLARLAEDLTARHGRGFSYTNLNKYRQFFLLYPNILPTVSGELATLPTPSEESGSAFNAEILQTLSANSDALAIIQAPSEKSATLSRKSPDTDWLELLQVLAARFPLPWSHYVKLLTVKDESARRRCLVILDLKLGTFTHADAGQMHLYLNYATEHWTHAGEKRLDRAGRSK